jgi:hypothetical protein
MRTLIYLDNGQSIRTDSNPAADIAGLVNAGVQNIYTCEDADSGETQHIVVQHIVSVTETP